MGRLSAKLRSVAGGRIGYFCPGCREYHGIPVNGSGRPMWTWDGNVDAPTCTPSVRHFTTDPQTGVEETICHYFLLAGKIQFCADSAHELAGKTVDLPDWPYAEGEFGGV